ncbi:MAG: hypothetical protein KDD34_08530 [Bdellovibrionales bacterium]|nr:hypothetical protein [Bdellovibrionales bacterium]
MKKSFLSQLLVMSSLVIFVGCGSDSTNYSLLPSAEIFEQTTAFNNKLDILFVISDKPSMSSHQAKLVASFATFINQFVSKGFDFKIAVVTTSAYMADPTLNGYDSADVAEADFNDSDGTQNSGIYVITPDDPNILTDFAINAKPDKNTSGQDGRAFSSFRQALNSTRPINQGFLRPDSFLAVVIVDNADDFSGNGRCVGCNVSGRYNAPTLDAVSVYKDYLETLTGTSGATARFNVSAMTQSASPCQGGQNMVRIMDLANTTNGVIGDICQSDFGASMAEISNQISTLSTQFFLDREPIVSSISVIVDGAVIAQDPNNGWQYNATANSITFHGTAVPAQGSQIMVNFDPLTIDTN